jgi:hypothetical protein
VRLRRGIKAWGNYLAGHHEVGGQAARDGRRWEKAARVGRRSGEDTADKWGPLDKETRERRPAREGVIRKGKRISCEDATDARAGWACGDGAASGLAGPEAKQAAGSAGPKIRKKEISELKLDFLNLPRLWKFVEGDLGGILT